MRWQYCHWKLDRPEWSMVQPLLSVFMCTWPTWITTAWRHSSAGKRIFHFIMLTVNILLFSPCASLPLFIRSLQFRALALSSSIALTISSICSVITGSFSGISAKADKTLRASSGLEWTRRKRGDSGMKKSKAPMITAAMPWRENMTR